ncbi:RDD family protein [Spirosoma pulveris]
MTFVTMELHTRDLLNADELLAEPCLPASQGKRFLNLLIDFVFFYIIMVTVGVIVFLISPYLLDSKILINRVTSMLLYVAYYLAFEAWLGKTPGKILTKTKVVNKNGQKPDLLTCLWRNLARLIPFDTFTFLREKPIGMHDRMSGTMVVDDRPSLSLDQSIRNTPD